MFDDPRNTTGEGAASLGLIPRTRVSGGHGACEDYYATQRKIAAVDQRARRGGLRHRGLGHQPPADHDLSDSDSSS